MVQVKLFQGISLETVETEMNVFMKEHSITGDHLVHVEISRVFNEGHLWTMIMLLYNRE